MSFLRSESAGPNYEGSAHKPSAGSTIVLALIITVCIVLAAALLVFYKRMFSRHLNKPA